MVSIRNSYVKFTQQRVQTVNWAFLFSPQHTLLGFSDFYKISVGVLLMKSYLWAGKTEVFKQSGSQIELHVMKSISFYQHPLKLHLFKSYSSGLTNWNKLTSNQSQTLLEVFQTHCLDIHIKSPLCTVFWGSPLLRWLLQHWPDLQLI